jgi:hypothetical protein
LQSAIEREVAERDDRAQWVRARSELQAVRSAAEERLAALIHTAPENVTDVRGNVNMPAREALGRNQGADLGSGPVKGGGGRAYSHDAGEVSETGGSRLGVTDGLQRRAHSHDVGGVIESRGDGAGVGGGPAARDRRVERRAYSRSVEEVSENEGGRAGVSERLAARDRRVVKRAQSYGALEEVSNPRILIGKETGVKDRLRRVDEARVTRTSLDKRSEQSGRGYRDRVRVRTEAEESMEPAMIEMDADWRHEDERSYSEPADPGTQLGGAERVGGSRKERRNSVAYLDEGKRRNKSAAMEPVGKSRRPPTSIPKGDIGRDRSVLKGEDKTSKGVASGHDSMSPSLKDMISELRKLATMRPAT